MGASCSAAPALGLSTACAPLPLHPPLPPDLRVTLTGQTDCLKKLFVCILEYTYLVHSTFVESHQSFAALSFMDVYTVRITLIFANNLTLQDAFVCNEC